MSRNNVKGPVPDYTPRKKVETQEIVLQFQPCINCGKKIVEGYYGRYGDGGTCSKACETVQSQKPLDFGEPK